MEENWFKVLEADKEDKILECLRNEFDKNNIKYKIDLEEKWEGSVRTPKYIGKFVLYAQDEFKSKVKEILNQYYENNLVSDEELENLKEDEDTTEDESKKIAKRQTRMWRIYIGIVLCMIISIIVGGIIFGA